MFLEEPKTKNPEQRNCYIWLVELLQTVLARTKDTEVKLCDHITKQYKFD